MIDLLLHPAWPFLIAALLVRFLPRPVGHVLMMAAPAMALLAMGRLDASTSVHLSFLDWQLEPLRVDALSTPFGWVFASAALIAGIYGMATQRGPERSAVLATAGAALGVVFAGDLLSLFLFWEIKAIASTLVILARRTPQSGRAGMRYLFVHIIGGKLLLMGILLHFGQTGSLTFEAFEMGPAAAFILLAFLVNAAVPPLHAWLQDGYPNATVAGTVFLSAFTTKSAVYALLRGFPGLEILMYLGVAMALIGVIYAILANDIRRLLCYHIVSQVGFMVTAVGIGSDEAINGAVAHAFAHILYKALLLMGVGAVLYATGRSVASSLGGIGNRMRGVMTLYMIGAVSISSLPLFSGFVSKEIITDAAQYGELEWVVILLKVASVGTFLSTGLKLPWSTWIGREGMGPKTNDGARLKVNSVPPTMIMAMVVAAGLNLAIGLVPDLLYNFMPMAVDYEPYRLGKVVENLQVLLFTALGFLLVLYKLPAKPKIALDVDWFYRRLPERVADKFAGGTRIGQTTQAGHDQQSDRKTPVRLFPQAGSVQGRERAETYDAGGAMDTADTHVDARTMPHTSTVSPTPEEPSRLRSALQRLVAPAGKNPEVAPTWAVGGVLIAAAVVILLVSVLS